MIEVRGDIWAYRADVRCVTTNGFIKSNGHAVLGRGVALQAAERYPELPRRLGARLKKLGNRVFYFTDLEIITFPVKHNWFEQADLKLIKQSAKRLVTLTDKYYWETVVLPKPGCGNGGLEWSAVKPVIEPILDDRFHVIDR